MQKFIVKTLILLLIVIIPNVTIGILRDSWGEYTAYTGNKNKQYIKQVDTVTVYTDLSHDSIGRAIRKTNTYGNSNSQENKKPKVLFIGDSFFDDPRLSSDSGIQALTNAYFGENIAYNIGAPGRGGFGFYNFLISEHYIEEPKVIICEVVERNVADVFGKLKKQIRTNEMTDIGYKNYYYLDLIFGNNFKDLNISRLVSRKSKTAGASGKVKSADEKKILFYKNELTGISDYYINVIVENLVFTQQYFSSKGIKIYFAIAPNKESLYPELFGESALPLLQDKLRSRNVNLIDIYSIAKSDRQKYYYSADSHWTAEGLKAFSQVVNKKVSDDLAHSVKKVSASS